MIALEALLKRVWDLESAVTPGKWLFKPHRKHASIDIVHPGGGVSGCMNTMRLTKEDMEFCHYARTALPLLAKLVKIQGEALEKVADSRKRDHLEPDDYTKLGCTMNIANEALAECEKLAGS